VAGASVIAVLALLLVSGDSAARASAHTRLAVSVVFQTDWVPRYRTADVYVIPARGGRRRALTRNKVDDVHPAWSPDGRTIVFSRKGDLLASNRRGGAVRRLTRTAMREVDAAWSPDGRRIAFEGGRFGREQIYVMNANGSDRRRITNDRSCARDPAWADGGERIVFLACSTGPTSLMSIRYDGADLRPIASNPPFEDFDYQPAVSPDSKRLVFTRTVNDTNQTELWIADADGSRSRRLIRDGAQAVWSPDGGRIGFVHGPHLVGDEENGFGFVGGPKVSVINADGTGLRHLTPQPEAIHGGVSPFAGWRWAQGGVRILGLSWSPTGGSIAYSHRLERRHPDIAVIGGRAALRRLTVNRRIDTQPALSPDGQHVAFVVFPRAGGFGSLLVLGMEGSGVRRLATGAWDPAWSPDGRWLAYDAADGIRIIHVSGSFSRRVAAESANGFVYSPAWSADGQRVHYLGTRRGGRRTAIWSVRRDGTDERRMGSLPSSVVRIDWSPDRTRAVFNRARRLFVMNADGSTVRALGPRHRRDVAEPAWCRNGRTVVYASRQDGDWDLYGMTTEGRVFAKLTDNLADDYVPDC
jgi:Tol biopolymer transport system component